jgi:1-acyl-sn-glycerol-3-phosphate acyltransferase
MVVVRSAVYALTFYLVTALMLVLGIWLLISPRSWAMQGLRLHGMICTWLLGVICGTRFEVRGREKLPEGACLVVSKHQSAWDTFALIPLFADPAIVLKDELKWIPVYGWFCVKFDHILVKRDRAAAALKQLIGDAQTRARQGRQILIFPEGTRTAPGADPDYKPGFVALYEGLGVPCAPLALNSGLYWPRRSFLRYPGTIVVEILEPIAPGKPRATFRKELVERIEEACDRLLLEAAASADPPPLGAEARRRLTKIK